MEADLDKAFVALVLALAALFLAAARYLVAPEDSPLRQPEVMEDIPLDDMSVVVII